MAVFTLALALGLAAPAVQDFTETQKDARCVVALQKMTEAPEVVANEKGKAAVTGVMLFYLGRLTTRVPAAQVERTIDTAADNFGSPSHKEHALACIEGMRALSGAAG